MLMFSEDDGLSLPIMKKSNSNSSALSKINFETFKTKFNFKSSLIQNPIQTNISNEKTSASHSNLSLNSSPLMISKA